MASLTDAWKSSELVEAPCFFFSVFFFSLFLSFSNRSRRTLIQYLNLVEAWKY